MNDKDVIVVGVDGTASGDAALHWACEEAARLGSSLTVVTAWFANPALVSNYAHRGTEELLHVTEDQAATTQRAAVDRVRGDRSEVEVSAQVVSGAPGEVLVRSARDARLLVVGSRGVGALRAAVLGSTSRYCATHAPCPVVVVPGPQSEDDPPA